MSKNNHKLKVKSSHNNSETGSSGTTALKDKIEFLKKTQSYPERPASVSVKYTHMSVVFLTESNVYKLKKPVRYEFLNYLQLKDRQQHCQEEVRLNRRLAPDIYLGVIPLCLDRQGKMNLENRGEVIDWLVKMRRLPDNLMLDQLIDQGEVPAEELGEAAHLISLFYKNSRPVPLDPATFQKRLLKRISIYHNGLLYSHGGLSARLIEKIVFKQRQTVTGNFQVFNQRLLERRIVDGHGDLRPEHICLIKPPVIMDCLEFNKEIRLLDPVDELAFLSLECEKLGAQWIEKVFFDVYNKVTSDNPSRVLIDFYKSYNAGIRAHLAIRHWDEPAYRNDPKYLHRTQTYLDLALKYL